MLGISRRFSDRMRGTAVVMTAMSITMMMGFAALAVDVGYLYMARTELQRAADASALAGAGTLFNQFGLDVAGAKSTATMIAAMNEAAEQPVALMPDDIVIGRFQDPLSQTCPFVPVNNGSANAVRVLAARRASTGNPIPLFFANIFGIESTSLGADATAARISLRSVHLVPIALRTPDFGPVDPDIAEQNPGKDGPSYPANGEAFEIGEPVVVFLYGKGPRPPVHLTFDLPQFGGVAETEKMLEGTEPPVPMDIGDEVPVWNLGSGDGNFGNKLYDRLQNGDPDDDTVVLPIVETTPESRDETGKITGPVRIVDFVGVLLTFVDEVDVQNPKFPDDPTKKITILRLNGRVVPVVVSEGDGTSTPGQYGGDTVVKLQLVR